MASVELRGLTKRYGELAVVDDVSLTIEHGRLVCLLGPSGCGKTTTLRLIAGFVEPSAGEIKVGDQVISSPARTLPPEDAVGFVELLLTSRTARLIGPTPRHLAVLRETLSLVEPTIGLPAGLETATLCREHGVRELLSCDRGMRAFTFLDVRDPCHGPEWVPDEPPRRRYRTLTGTPRRRG